MQVTTVIAIYFLIWWLSLFVVLPFGIRSQHEDVEFSEGTDPGAPIAARIGMKLVWTTVVATIVFGILTVIYRSGVVDLDAFMNWLLPGGRY
jgi:predicted secreted protein